MPWQECNLMDERLKFIAGLLDGEKMAVLCRRFGISRKTGYKILNRYNSCGLEGLTDRSRRDGFSFSENAGGRAMEQIQLRGGVTGSIESDGRTSALDRTYREATLSRSAIEIDKKNRHPILSRRIWRSES